VPLREPDDTTLLERLEKRDADALMGLYRRYSTRVYSLILRIVEDRSAAEELLQDCFYKLWERPHLYDAAKGTLISWLLTVARNLALDYKRKESRRGVHHVVLDNEPGEGPGIEDFAKATAGVEPEVAHAIRQAMDALPPAQRGVLEMAYFEGLTHQELAERTGESLGTIKTRIRLGVSKLREALRGFGSALML